MKDFAERLEVEVPKQIEIIKARGGLTDADRARAKELSGKIAKDGKTLMFGGDDAKAEALFADVVFNLAVAAISFDEKNK